MEESVVECEEIDVVFVVRTKNAEGKSLAVATTQPVKLLRATTPDVWAFIDEQLAKQQK